jgi:hypothetical protein
MIDSNLTTNGDRMYTVPKVSDVARWDIISSGEGVLEEEAAIYHDVYTRYIPDFHKVSVPGQKAKYFKGETAWMDSQRYADDERFKIRIAKDYG